MSADNELIEKMRVKDEAAFELLYARYGRAVRIHLEKIVREPMVAEDLSQEVFLRVWEHVREFENKGAFRAWILRIASNLAFNYLRSVRRKKEQSIEQYAGSGGEVDEENFVPTWVSDPSMKRPDTAVETAENLFRINSLIDQLPEEKRRVIRYVNDMEMSVRDIAKKMNVAEGTVKSRLYYARKILAVEYRKINDKG